MDKPKKPTNKLRIVNNCLTVLIILVALYVIAAPFLPQFSWWIKHSSPIKTIVYSPPTNPADTPAAEQKVAGDMLFIPSIDLQEAVYGGGIGNLNKGVWRVPHTSSPDKGGNTVLVGHRFTYKDPTGVLYYLDKVHIGDKITMHWQGKVYEYTVAETKVVPASEISIENNTAEPQLTIYTCTPVWSVANRLVIITKPVEVTP